MLHHPGKGRIRAKGAFVVDSAEFFRSLPPDREGINRVLCTTEVLPFQSKLSKRPRLAGSRKVIVGRSLTEGPVKGRKDQSPLRPYDVDDPVDQDIQIGLVPPLHQPVQKLFDVGGYENILTPV